MRMRVCVSWVQYTHMVCIVKYMPIQIKCVKAKTCFIGRMTLSLNHFNVHLSHAALFSLVEVQSF